MADAPIVPPRTGKGRPYALTLDVREALLEAAECRLSIKNCALLAGIGESTLELYLRRGRAAATAQSALRVELATKRDIDPSDIELDDVPVPVSEAPFLSLLRDWEKARAQNLKKAAKAWVDQFDENWTAAAEYLHRQGGPEWQRSQKIEHSGRVEGGVKTFQATVHLPQLGDEGGSSDGE